MTKTVTFKIILIIKTQIIYSNFDLGYTTVWFLDANHWRTKQRKTSLTVLLNCHYLGHFLVTTFVLHFYPFSQTSYNGSVVLSLINTDWSHIVRTTHTGNVIFPQETKILSHDRLHPPGPTTPTDSLHCMRGVCVCLSVSSSHLCSFLCLSRLCILVSLIFIHLHSSSYFPKSKCNLL